MRLFYKLLGSTVLFSFFALQSIELQVYPLGEFAQQDSGYAQQINNNNVVIGKIKKGLKELDFIWDKERGAIPNHYINVHAKRHTNQIYPYSVLINNHNSIAAICWLKTDYWFTTNNKYYKSFCLCHFDENLQELGIPEGWDNSCKETRYGFYSYDDNKKLGMIGFNDKQQLLVTNSLDLSKGTQFAIWQEGIFYPIPETAFSLAYAINNEGLILARKWMEKAGQTVPMLILYDFEKQETIEIIKDINLKERKLNDLGQVSFIQVNLKEQTAKGLLWDKEKGLTDLDNFLPFALNNCNQMIGFKFISIEDCQPYFWDRGDLINLNEKLNIGKSDSLWEKIEKLSSLNDQGSFVGEAISDGAKQPFIVISP